MPEVTHFCLPGLLPLLKHATGMLNEVFYSKVNFFICCFLLLTLHSLSLGYITRLYDCILYLLVLCFYKHFNRFSNFMKNVSAVTILIQTINKYLWTMPFRMHRPMPLLPYAGTLLKILLIIHKERKQMKWLPT